jgi:hypothetical protein
VSEGRRSSRDASKKVVVGEVVEGISKNNLNPM